jgi:hypothetical protein
LRWLPPSTSSLRSPPSSSHYTTAVAANDDTHVSITLVVALTTTINSDNDEQRRHRWLRSPLRPHRPSQLACSPFVIPPSLAAPSSLSSSLSGGTGTVGSSRHQLQYRWHRLFMFPSSSTDVLFIFIIACFLVLLFLCLFGSGGHRRAVGPPPWGRARPPSAALSGSGWEARARLLGAFSAADFVGEVAERR